MQLHAYHPRKHIPSSYYILPQAEHKHIILMQFSELPIQATHYQRISD